MEADLPTLKYRKLKEASFLWRLKYETKYIKKYGIIDTEKKRIKFHERMDNAYFANSKLKKIRNEGYASRGMSYRE